MKELYSYLPILLTLLISGTLSNQQQCLTPRTIEEIRNLRLEQLKNSILAQLGLTEPPQNSSSAPNITVDPTTEEEYNQLVNEGSVSTARCYDDFYAKPIQSFVGIMSPAEDLVLRYRRQLTGTHSGNRTDEEDVITPVILNQYIINVNFSLPRDLSKISRAHLLLYQEPTDNLNQDASLEVDQLVQIRTVINKVRHYIETKAIRVQNSGFHAFDITRAAELWVEDQEEVAGDTVLEVLVTCETSPNCSEGARNNNTVARVTFTHNTSDPNKMPRIITLSRNPREVASEEGRNRRKRQLEVSLDDLEGEPEYCSTNESICCLHKLEIDLAQLGFGNYITRPRKFKANFCRGFCPRAGGLRVASNRTELLRHLSIPAALVNPCCTGVEYRELEVLVATRDPSTGKYRNKMDVIDNVRVVKCGCA